MSTNPTRVCPACALGNHSKCWIEWAPDWKDGKLTGSATCTCNAAHDPTATARDLAVPLPGSYRAICDWCLTLFEGDAGHVSLALLAHAIEAHPGSPIIGEGPQARAATVVSEDNPWASPPGVRPDGYIEPF